MAQPRTLYDVLGVDREVQQSGLKRAFHQLSRKYHPDKQSEQESQSAEAFVELAKAWSILSCPATRAQYDAALARMFCLCE